LTQILLTSYPFWCERLGIYKSEDLEKDKQNKPKETVYSVTRIYK